MKKIRIAAAALAALVAASAAPAFANIMDPDKIDKKIDKMKQELALTDEQANSVKGILEEHHDKMKALKKEKHDRIEAVLTPEQRDKFKDMVKKWEEAHEKHAEMADKEVEATTPS